MLLGVVADPCSLLFSVDRNHNRIDVEHQGARQRWQTKQMRTQTVVKSSQLADGLERQPLQEPAQGGLIGKTIQAQHLQESPVVLQDLGLVDASQSHNDSVEKRQDQFGEVIVGGSLRRGNIALEQSAQTQPVAKTLDQPHPAEVRDMGFLEGNTDFSGTFAHVTESSPMVRFVSRSFYHDFETLSSSAMLHFTHSEIAAFAHY